MKLFARTLVGGAILAAMAGAYADREVRSDPYPLGTCPVTGYALGTMGEPHVVKVEEQEIAVCCEVCVLEIELHPQRFITRVNREIAEQQREDYPLDRCIVADVPVTGNADPVDFVYKNRLYRFHSQECVQRFLSSPAPYVVKHEDAVKQAHSQAHSIPGLAAATGADPGSGDATIDIIVGQHLVRIPEQRGEEQLHNKPWKYLGTLDQACPASSTLDADGPAAW